MATLVILYGHPTEPAAFEDYYHNQHIPYAAEHMPGVRDARNRRVLTTADGAPAPYYRVSELTYDSRDDLHAGISSAEGRAVLADLDAFATGGATVLVTEE